MRGGGPNIRDAGLGDLSVLSDALMLELLGSGVLRAADLARLALASKALYCFANLEETWKGLVIEELGGRFTWAGTWQRTYLISTGLLPPEPALEVEVEADAEVDQEAEAESEVEQEEPRQQEKQQGGAKGRKGAKKGKKGKAAAAAAANGGCSAAGTDGDVDDGGVGPGPSSTAAAAAAAAADGAARPGQRQRRRRSGPLVRSIPGCGRQRYLRVKGFYSDLLYQPWFCATLEPPADWLEIDNIDRRSGLTPEQFRAEYGAPNRPVILTDAMARWPAMAKWSNDYLAGVFGDRDVIVGNMPMPFSTYRSYCAANRDEQPLYLFDKRFAAVAPSLEADYAPPVQFGEDLFSLLGEEGRPHYRWLILGPARSGSNFHVDPNATSAWNGLLWGAKKWVMYPPGVPPPGVHPSPDGADVAQPFSLTEWFVNFYAATREGKRLTPKYGVSSVPDSLQVRPVEFVARPGELLFVPRGWWHCALNLEESCALTQNFVSEVGLPATLAFLHSRRPEMVSGCAHESRCNLYDRFVEVLREKRPQLLAAVEAKREEARARAREANKLAALFKQSAPQQEEQPPASNSHCKVGAEAGETAAAAGQGASGGGAGGAGGGFSFGFSIGGASSCAGGGGEAAPAPGGGFKFGFGV
ncbi:hypothetical protein GPECTOR_2g1599 [Gonium pectorale]|uniref:JmjC domain-containing protein n=1 Tax=Gonium pectorale TaxID=33097 RepID=A0A150H1M0_GONPE|nr:hypothetical protein GPECTOR_2g1599 [Gonium pectorale]|eukprot:KXZ56047.1 hypothetical protein GPECTOR_2g1599 [Gonium pectorale]